MSPQSGDRAEDAWSLLNFKGPFRFGRGRIVMHDFSVGCTADRQAQHAVIPEIGETATDGI